MGSREEIKSKKILYSNHKLFSNHIVLHNHKLLCNNKGLSLIELLVSIAIFTILVLPLLHNFVIAATVNSKAKRIQNETTLAESLIEEIKGKPMVDFAKEYNYPSDFGIEPANQCELKWTNGYDASEGYEVILDDYAKSTSKSVVIDEDGQSLNQYHLDETPGKTYLFAKKNITYGNHTYDALITIDSEQYKTIGYNNFQMPIITEINTKNNVLAVQSYEEEMAVATLHGNHTTYCVEQNALHADEAGYSEIVCKGVDDVRSFLNKTMYVNIRGDNEEAKVTVEFEYTCPTIISCGVARYTVIDKIITKPFGSIYLFYQPSTINNPSSPSDKIIITKDSQVTDDIDVYIIKQGDTINYIDTAITKPDNIHIYSNAILNPNLVKKEEAKNRIYQIKVQLFHAGHHFNSDEFCVEFSSTKKE